MYLLGLKRAMVNIHGLITVVNIMGQSQLIFCSSFCNEIDVLGHMYVYKHFNRVSLIYSLVIHTYDQVSYPVPLPAPGTPTALSASFRALFSVTMY